MSSVAPAAAPAPAPSLRSIDRERLEIPHPRPFVAEVTVTAAHLSPEIPHASNIEYVRWLDRTAQLHADDLGYTRASLHAAGVMWFVARHEIDYEAEAWEDDTLVIATWVRDVRRVKSWREFVVHRPADDAVVCRASTLWVLVDLESRRPTRIPDEMARAFEPVSPAR